jgi:beta-lactamase superfamily II metal-dependent hydrolase
MSSQRIDYGGAPASNQIEVTVFGPGYGEAIAVHVGLGRWLLIDSCIAPDSDIPASADYLTKIGVPTNAVKAIVASHWHDDHVRGMSQLVEAYPTADLIISAVFADKQARAFLAAYSGFECSGLSRGTKEMYQSLQGRPWIPAANRTEVFQDRSSSIPVQVVAFSPTQPALAQFLAHILDYVPKLNADMPIIQAPEISPNLSSIVLHIELGPESILLGADMECHETAGWEVIVSDRWCQIRSRAGLFKNAHHGSTSGDHPDVWANLLAVNPVTLMSPFNNGRHTIPTAADRDRILKRTTLAYITSTASRRPQLPTEQLKRLQDMATNVRPVQSGFGALRARRTIGTDNWTVETFGFAGTLQSMVNIAA